MGVEVVGLGIMRPRPLARSVPGRRPPGAPAPRRGHGRLDSRDVEHGAPSPTETWDDFFSEFYLRAFREAERNARAEEEALAAARLSGCPPGGDLLDVPCGFGRHALPLAARGLRVIGVDRAQPLLDEAKRRAGQGRWPKLVRADYRELPFADESFDAALNLFSSLGYLGDEEDTRALAEIGRVLRPGGAARHRDHAPRPAGAPLPEHDWHLLGEGRLLLEQRTFDPAPGLAQTTQTLIDARRRARSRTFSIRVYTATELLGMLDRAGFAETRCHGDLEGGPFATDTRLVVAATR